MYLTNYSNKERKINKPNTKAFDCICGLYY